MVVHEKLGVVISDIPGNTIWRISGDGLEPLRHGIHSHDLVSGVDGSIYGTNPDPSGTLSSVWRIDPAGRFSHVVPPAPGHALVLQSFLIARDGTIFSANRYDHRMPTVVLLRRERSGEIRSVAGGPPGFADGVGSHARFSAIDGMREMSDGSLLVVDGAHLRIVTRAGAVSTLTRPLTVRRWGEDLLGMSSILDDTVHVADHSGRRILRVRLATGLVDERDRSSFFWSPAGVEQTTHGLYVLEHLRPPLSLLGDLQIGPYLRVRRVASDGSASTMAVVWGRQSWKASAVASLFFLTVFWLRRTLRSRRQ